MTNKKLAKIINDYIPCWEKESENKKENYKMILNTLNEKNCIDELYNYFVDDYETETLKIILNELKKRLEV